MNLYQETAEIPVITTRRTALMKAFDNASTHDFMNTLYKFAEDDLYASRRDHFIGMKRTAAASMTEMLHDRDSGQMDMLAILLSIPQRVLKALIWGTLGYEYTTDPEFRNLFFPADNDCGVYVNTILVKGREGRSLTNSEWHRVRELIKVYRRGEGVIVTDASSLQVQSDANFAIDVDNAYGRRGTQAKRYDPKHSFS